MASDAAIGAVFGELLRAILEAKNKALMFRSILERMQSTLESVIPAMEEIQKLNEALDYRKEEAEKIMKVIKKGEKLVLECSRICWFTCWKRPKYTDKLLDLEKSLMSFCQIVMQVQQTRDIKQSWLEVKDMRLEIKSLILNRNIANNLHLNRFTASCAVPEPPVNPVGLEVPLGELKMELFKEKVTTVVLSAPPGCGKTTLAKLFCHDKEVKGKFKDNIFYVIVSKNPALENIVQRLFQHKGYQVPDFRGEEDVIYCLEQFFKTIVPDLVLLVLDDVWPESESLLYKLNFQNMNLKILVTSRSTFPRLGSTYKLKPLNSEDSMTLFCNSAFLLDQKFDIPEEEDVNKIVKGCKGCPLALKVVGRSLCGEPAEIWKTRAMELSVNGSIFEYRDLLNCLQSSLDALDNKVIVKECFFDLCSFPEDQRIPVTALIDMWVELYKLDEDGVCAVANLHELSSRNLVDLIVTRKDLNGFYDRYFVTQHDLLRELAICKSNLESIEQTQRLILEISGNDVPDWWLEQKQPSVSSHLLSISTDEKFSSSWCSIQAPEVRVLVLNFRAKKYTLPKFLEKMEKLKVLIFRNYGLLPAEISNFPLLGSASNLKRIRLEHVSLPSYIFTSLQLKNLWKITLVQCNIGQAFGPSTIWISDALPNLEEINIDYCNDLVELPVQLCYLFKLKKLSITNCHNLVTLPQEIGNLVNLEVLRLTSCIELSGLPNTIESLQMLQILDISECSEIEKLPEQIDKLRKLRKLHMIGCTKVSELPLSILKIEHSMEVICNEETAHLWEPITCLHKNFSIKVQKEDINLHWLYTHQF